jgi:hypothetical protein
MYSHYTVCGGLVLCWIGLKEATLWEYNQGTLGPTTLEQVVVVSMKEASQ